MEQTLGQKELEFHLFMAELVQNRDKVRIDNILGILAKLGYTFDSEEATGKFFSERLTMQTSEQSPGITRIILDFEKPAEMMLAEFNDNPIFTEEDVRYCDYYPEEFQIGPETRFDIG